MQKQETEREVTLFELWRILVKRRVTIFTVTAIITIAAGIYASTAVPIYRGEAVIEIGQVVLNYDQTNSKPTIIQLVEPMSSLLTLSADTHLFKVKSLNESMVKITCESGDKKFIKETILNASNKIFNRQQDKINFYVKAGAIVTPSKVVYSVIQSEPVKPNKPVIIIVAFICGMILSLFLAFFIEFIQLRTHKRSNIN